MYEQDRYLTGQQLEDAADVRCKRRDGCRVSVHGDLPRGTGKTNAAEGEDRPRVAYTSELSALEEAVVKILPRWREAYEAVIAYARQIAGYVAPDAGGIPNGYLPDG